MVRQDNIATSFGHEILFQGVHCQTNEPGGKFVLPIEVASIQVSRVSQATLKSDSLNSYDLDQPRGQ